MPKKLFFKIAKNVHENSEQFQFNHLIFLLKYLHFNINKAVV